MFMHNKELIIMSINNILMDTESLSDTISRISHNIAKDIKNSKKINFVGIRTRGNIIAERILKEIKKQLNVDIPLGVLDITLYRDDFRTKDNWPKLEQSTIDFDIDGKDVIIVDDVIYTGRTARAAIEAIMDYGRPSSIKLVALIDRGNRELPIQPDYVGLKINTLPENRVNVYLKEMDSREEVVIDKN